MTTLGSPPLRIPLDGRQSQRAAEIARGLRRHLRLLGAVSLTELPLAGGLRADVVAMAPDGTLSVFEIKSCLADFRADGKWRGYRDYCDRFYFAVAADFPRDVLPDDAGLAVADSYGAELLRGAPEQRLAAPARKAMLLRFASAAAARLHALYDPEIGL